MAAYANKTAVILGGTHGIGLATAKALVSQGAKVVVTGRRPDPVAVAKAELGTPSALVLQSDITLRVAHAELRTEIEKHFGASSACVDLLFVNVGYAGFVPAVDSTEEQFNRHFDTNTRGAFFVTQCLVPLVKPGGAVVFTTSVSIGAGMPGMALYSASKAAVYSFVQTLAAELVRGKDGKPGIRVNSVSPGFVDTPTMGVLEATPEHLKEFAAVGAKETPMGRLAAPEEIAKAVLFLGFDATFTTGVEFLVDGGMRFLRPALE